MEKVFITKGSYLFIEPFKKCTVALGNSSSYSVLASYSRDAYLISLILLCEFDNIRIVAYPRHTGTVFKSVHGLGTRLKTLKFDVGIILF